MKSLLNLIEFKTNTYRGGRKVCKLGNIVTEYPPVLAGGYSVTCCVKTNRARAKIFDAS